MKKVKSLYFFSLYLKLNIDVFEKWSYLNDDSIEILTNNILKWLNIYLANVIDFSVDTYIFENDRWDCQTNTGKFSDITVKRGLL